MLLPYFKLLATKQIILGSQSVSRNDLMKTQLPQYQIIPSTFAEDLDKKSFPSAKEYNIATCQGKVEELMNRFKTENKQWDILITCDTIVQSQGQIIQKPENKQHCIKMMQGLSNKWHKVYSAHNVVFNLEKPLTYSWVIEADVKFGEIPIQSIQQYSNSKTPYQHSGGYELFGVSGSFIQQIKGSVTSIQGIDTYQVGKYIIQGIKEAKWA